jgi:ABC-type uncharacterized transport system
MSRPPRGGTSAATQAFAAAGVVGAIVLSVLLNVLVGRHYRRWDLTSHGLYSLSPATVETLHALGETIHIDVLLPSSDPITSTVRFLLAAYQGETDKLDVRYTDPDRHPAEFLVLQQKYGIEAGKTEDGQVVMDAAIVVSRSGGKPFFLSSAEFVDVSDDKEAKARSKMEQAFTLTLRSVMGDDRPRICFTTGHGEKRLDDGGPRGLGELQDRLKKNNYDAVSVDTAAPHAEHALDGCRVAVIAGPTEPFSAEEGSRIAAFFHGGGNLFVLAGPVPDGPNKRMLPLSLDVVTQAGGIRLDEDFVFEGDPARKLPGGFGEQFLAEPRTHDVTLGLVGPRNQDLKILMSAARSLSPAGNGVAPAELLATSPDAFGMTDFFAWADRGGAPERKSGDRKGPLALAMASELAPSSASGPSKGQGHGPRMVVVGAVSVALGQSWQERVLRGGALFTESALSWLAARPPIVDIPDKPAVAGARINEASLGDVLRYVTLYMPGAVALLGLAVFLRRRSTEGRVVRAGATERP